MQGDVKPGVFSHCGARLSPLASDFLDIHISYMYLPTCMSVDNGMYRM